MTGPAVPYGAAVPSLTRWGVSSDADLVFRTLATFGAHTARRLAADLGMPRQRVGDALAELHACEAITSTVDVDRIWSSRPTADVVQRLRRRRLRAIDTAGAIRRHQETVDMLNERLAGLGLPTHPVPVGPVGTGVRYLPNRPLTRHRLAELMAQERHDHLVINTEEVLDADVSRSAPIDDIFTRGVRFRVLSRPPLDGDATDPNVSPEHRLAGTFFHYRETLDTPLKLFICDRRTALIPVDPADVDRGYLEIIDPDVVRALVELFEARWEAAVDPSATGVPAIVLTARERELIELLALGHTDVTAAQRLRISSRSVTNHLRTLMDRLSVDNRFQLGLALGALRVTVPSSLVEEPPCNAAPDPAEPA